MNYVKINTFFDFDKIIYSEIIFTGSVDEEIEENCWAITIKPSLAKKISIDGLREYVNELLKQKREQVIQANVPATFYMWVDEQAFQLQFNILSGHTTKLPFGCTVNLVKDLKPLLEKFIEISKKGYIGWDEVTIIDRNSPDFVEIDDDNPENYTMDVFLELM